MPFNRLAVLVVAGVFGMSCSVHGLEELIVASPETSDEQRRVERQKYLDELIGSIQKACHLSEAEVRRLRVASKGAVEYSFTDAPNAHEIRTGRRVNVLRVEIRQGQARFVVSPDAAVAAKHAIWSRTLERTLDREELEKAKRLASEQLERWTQRFAAPPNLRGGINVAPIRVQKIRAQKLRLIRDVPPVEINRIRRLDLIADPPLNR